jgi:hypothetical protein
MRSRCFHAVVAVTFLIGISLPLGLLHWQPTSTVEQRTLAPFPQLNWSFDGLTGLPTAFEQFFNDHFGGRYLFIHGYSWLLFSVLGVSPTEKVIAGKHGWLFYELGRKDFGPDGQFARADLAQWKEHLETKYRWLQEQGITYVFIIAPDKHTIYKEHLPSLLAARLPSPSRYDQLMNYMKSYSNVPIVDLRPALLEAKKTAQVYRKIDSHWNIVGSAAAQYEIASYLANFYPTLQPKQYRSGDFLVEDHVGGDLSDMMNVVLQERIPLLPLERFASCETQVVETAIPMRPQIFTECPHEKGIDALIFRDSFFTALQPYISQYFHRATYIWTRPTLMELQKVVMARKPDVVLEERIERDLSEIPLPDSFSQDARGK